jgi:hypothetical protein
VPSPATHRGVGRRAAGCVWVGMVARTPPAGVRWLPDTEPEPASPDGAGGSRNYEAPGPRRRESPGSVFSFDKATLAESDAIWLKISKMRRARKAGRLELRPDRRSSFHCSSLFML